MGQEGARDGGESREGALGLPGGGLGDQLAALPIMTDGSEGASECAQPDDASSGGHLQRGAWNSAGDGVDGAPAGAGRP